MIRTLALLLLLPIAAFGQRTVTVNSNYVLTFPTMTNFAVANSNGITQVAQPKSANLTAFDALAGTGLIVQAGAGSYLLRAITGDTEIVVANGDGVAGAPTLSIGAAIARTASVQPASAALSNLAANPSLYQLSNTVLTGVASGLAGWGSAGQIATSTGSGVGWSNAPSGSSSGFIWGNTTQQVISNTTAATAVMYFTNSASMLSNDGEKADVWIDGHALSAGQNLGISLTIWHGGTLIQTNFALVTQGPTGTNSRPFSLVGRLIRISSTKAMFAWGWRFGSSGTTAGSFGAANTSYDPSIVSYLSNDRTTLTNASYSLDWSVATNEFMIMLKPGHVENRYTIEACGVQR